MNLGPSGAIARAFVDSKLTPLLVVASVLLGLMAVILLPREEEPQIKVPMVDVMVAMPGASAKEVEERVVRPMEQLLWEIHGVEYLYSTAMDGQALCIVRFKVGEDVEDSLVKLNQKLQANYDRIPAGVSQPLIKPRSIDDVPILALVLHGGGYDHAELRRIAAELETAVKRVPQVAETRIIGGQPRQVRVLLDPARLAARGLAPLDVVQALQANNRADQSGRLIDADRSVLIEVGGFLHDEREVAALVIGVHAGRPVYLRDVASVIDGAAEPATYTFHGTPAAGEQPSVTLSIAKRPGANAIAVSRAVLAEVEAQRGQLLPADLQITVARDYGVTAAEKSDELLFHMAIAIVSVSLLILFLLGWRASLVVAIAIPATLALTLLVLYLAGYTLNRITLFALIFSIGILVDDAIVVVENIYRRVALPESRGKPLMQVAVEAVAEVGNPTILATIAVIAAILPMAMVGGLMGPYMRPIPVGASAAMLFSLAVAFIVTPWAAVRILRPSAHGHDPAREGRLTRAYRWLMQRLLSSAAWRGSAIAGSALLLAAALSLVPLGAVRVKMLPFDNKSEFQVVLNMPEGTALERTAAVTRELAAVLAEDPEVEHWQAYVGTASPFNFNGLVRHYFNRSGDHVADIQVNLRDRHQRALQSHDIAKRLRPRLQAVAERAGGRVTVAEVPPGPPVLQTLVAEIYAPSERDRLALAEEVKRIFRETPGVVDLDWYIEAPQPRVRFVVDQEKAALAGIPTAAIADTVRLAVSGLPAGLAHIAREREDVPIVVEFPESLVHQPEDLLGLRVRGPQGLVPLRELGRLERTVREPSIHHKNLLPVTYVVADVAGVVESPAYAIFAINRRLAELDARRFGGRDARIALYNAVQPVNDLQPAIKWDGEWQITLEVFRDLGLAFAGCIVLIYLLMVGWFKSFVTPLTVMVVIPFSLLGVLPAHALMPAADGSLGVFFTATSMIGFMAGAGIVVRNSVILVDFIEAELAAGRALSEAAIQAGIVRFRPMLLTALAVVVGAAVILADPIFQGLALALMAGSLASLVTAPIFVPLFYALQRRTVG
ncbi:MAG: efflux RND transporter permease subunit [Planctomycetota bacterium]|nr:efflux RND transporter permease subunit [Planctomycetota bacterium]MDW8373492.1 efflux RND transporter permease subunit [Planctomycetota bacterium]